MNHFRVRSAFLLLLTTFVGICLWADPADSAALGAFPDFLQVRADFLSAVVTAPVPTALSFKTAYRDTASGRVRVSVERSDQSLFIMFLRERDGAYPYGTRGNIIVKRDASTGYMQQIKWVLSDDGLSWIVLRPKNERTIIDYVVGASMVRSELSVSTLVYYFLMQPFSFLYNSTRASLDWSLVLGAPGSSRGRDFSAAILADRPAGTAAAFLRAVSDRGYTGAYLAMAGHASSLPEERTSVAYPFAVAIDDERDSGTIRPSAWQSDRGVPLQAATAVILNGIRDGQAFLGFMDGLDGRYPYKLAIVPWRSEDGSYQVAAVDAEGRRAVDWGDLVKARPSAAIRLYAVPLP